MYTRTLIGHLSEDTSVLCPPLIYREFGLPFREKLVRKFEIMRAKLKVPG